jgi:hypothetical protein
VSLELLYSETVCDDCANCHAQALRVSRPGGDRNTVYTS